MTDSPAADSRSLRERLEAKIRRRATFPVLVADPRSAEEALAAITAALQLRTAMRPQMAQRDDFDVEEFDAGVMALREQVAAAQTKVNDCYVLVEIEALPEDEWEAVMAATSTGDPDDIDVDDVRAAILAVSCVEPELRDEAFWRARLADRSWATGEKRALAELLDQLNLNAPRGTLGKG